MKAGPRSTSSLTERSISADCLLYGHPRCYLFGRNDPGARPLAYDNTYSRVVAWLKIALPLIALAILSTLFMFSRQYDPEAAIPFSEAEVEEILQEQRVREPRYAGMTRDGAAVRISADAAQPDRDAPARLTARALEGRVETPDGGWLDIRAGAGGIDQTADTARMEQDVRIETSTGYRIETDTLTTALDATSVASDGAVTAEGPPGELIAGRMEMRPVEGQADRYVLDFTDGVRLLYVPPGE